jgi:hypothetical protein
MNKTNNNKINTRKMLLATGFMAVLAIFLTNTLTLNGAQALDNGGGYAFLDCVYDNGTNKEICCDGPSDNIKCMECDVNLETGQKSNCKQVPNKAESSKNPKLPGSVFDGNVLGVKDPIKQSQGLGKLSQSPLSSSE